MVGREIRNRKKDTKTKRGNVYVYARKFERCKFVARSVNTQGKRHMVETLIIKKGSSRRVLQLQGGGKK
jgi:hypothetical protein